MKENNTLEHLMMIMSTLKQPEKRKQGMIIKFCDIKKCFDRCHLDDMMYNLYKNKVNIKALRLFLKNQEKTS